MSNTLPPNLRWTDRSEKKLIDLLLNRTLETHPYGCYCNVLIEKDRVLKAYSDKKHRDNSVYWQGLAALNSLGPEVGEEFEIVLPPKSGWRKWSVYISERAYCTLSGGRYFDAVDYLKGKFNELNIPYYDLDKPSNLGVIKKKIVCIDFNLFGSGRK